MIWASVFATNAIYRTFKSVLWPKPWFSTGVRNEKIYPEVLSMKREYEVDLIKVHSNWTIVSISDEISVPQTMTLVVSYLGVIRESSCDGIAHN